MIKKILPFYFNYTDSSINRDFNIYQIKELYENSNNQLTIYLSDGNSIMTNISKADFIRQLSNLL